MKQLTCEMCGSTDLMKQDGVFVCQSCGTKYSIEEARKLMIEGTVDVTGSTVKVDTSAEMANLYQIARRAKDDNNGENAAKYYDMILVKDPTSWEAYFYVVYFKAMKCKIAQIRSAAISVNNCEDSVLALIRDHVSEDNQKDAVCEIVMRSIIVAKMLAGGAKSHYNGIDSDIKSKYTQEYIDNACAARDILYTCGSQIEYIFGNRKEIALYAVDAWKAGIEIHTELLPYFADESGNRSVIASYTKKIGKYDPAYEKQYISDTKAQLESEIATLERIITNTPTEPKWNGCCIFFIIFGVVTFFILIGLAADEMLWLVSVFLVALAIFMGKPDMEEVEKNRKIVSDAKAKLAQKEAALAKLK